MSDTRTLSLLLMPSPAIITRSVVNAAGACFEAGDSIRQVAAAIGVRPSSVASALHRGRNPNAPSYLRRMAAKYDAYQAEEQHREARRERLRAKLAGAAGRDAGDEP